MADAPLVAALASTKVQLEKGQQYKWCSCGRSKTQPWCDCAQDDGSCTRSTLKPVVFVAEDGGEHGMCMCKQSKNKPFCDGSHRHLPKDIMKTQKANAIRKGSMHGHQATGDIEDLGKPATAEDFMNAEPTEEEPYLAAVKLLARDGLSVVGHHGAMGSMGVPLVQLPMWQDIQFTVAQMATKPLLDDDAVATKLVIGPRAKKPLVLDIPLFVSDMSYGSLSEEAKIALAKGAELAGTGICSGEGGMLPEEQEANSKYFYELASAKFGFSLDKVQKCQAFHFKGGQGAKTGTGGHLPGRKVTQKISDVRGVPVGTSAISPSTFTDMTTAADFKKLADEVREATGGIPIGFKLSAQHIEADIDFALEASADYIILDGRGGGTGAAPLLFRNNISVPTIPALARARRHLDYRGATDVTLIATGGLRLPEDFSKAMALGADGIAVSNAALHSIGCVAARMCGSNQCPSGVATQDPKLRRLLDVDKSAKQLNNFFQASTHLMQVLARACGHDDLQKFNLNDLTTWKKDMAELSGVPFGGVGMTAPAPRVQQLEIELALARRKIAEMEVAVKQWQLLETKDEHGKRGVVLESAKVLGVAGK